MRIQHNIMAMGAYRNYTNNTNALKKNLEKLSSGYKINRAGDDAAGLAISEKMRAQITGLQVAQKNAKDGISLVQTAEGALTEVHDMLNRMYALAEQSANGTYDNEVDRVQLQKEVESLRTEINRIADSSNFNGIKLLDGSMATKSASALASTNPIADSMIDGSSPTKAGAAEISVKLADATAAASKAMAYTTADGSAVSAATPSTIELKMGGVTGTISASLTLADIEVTIGGKMYAVDATKTTVAEQAAAWVQKFNDDTSNADFTASADASGNITLTAKDDTIGSNTSGVTGTWTGPSGGAAGTVAITAAGTASSSKSTTSFTTTAITDVTNIDLSGLGANEKITVNGNTYTYDGTNATALQNSMEADGFTLSGLTTGAKIEAANATIDNKAGGSTLLSGAITAGTTKLSEIKDLTVNGVKIGDYYDVELLDANNNAKTGDNDIVGNGYTIKLTAKIGGDATTETIYKNLTDPAEVEATGVNGSITGTAGVNEGEQAVGATKSKYTMTFDLGKLANGQTIQIDNKTFEITTDASKTNGSAMDTTSTPPNNNIAIVIAGLVPGAGETIEDKIADQIKSAITNANGLGTTNWTVDTTNSKVTPASGGANAKYTLVLETTNGQSAVDNTNLGEGRVKVSDPTAIAVDYDPAPFTPATSTSGSPFASVTYTSNVLKTGAYDVGDKITIGDAVIEIVDDNTAASDMTATQIKKSDVATAGKLENIIEQQTDFGSGRVAFDLANGTITITGVTVGQTGADLAKEIGTVSEYSKATSQANASKATNSAAGMEILAGTTAISTLKNAALDNSGTKLGDIFNITINGSSKDDSYVIQEGDEVKFTAKVNGKLDDSIMTKFNYSGAVTSLSSKNGYDEGSAATGNKTHYDLTIDLTKVAGGNSFTFGNVNGKSITFDLSYDKDPTKNDTIGASNKTDISDNSTRVTINLFGKTTAQAQQEILDQVKAEMAKADFNVTASTSGNKITLNVDANQEGEEYNLGNIRLSSQSGAFTNPVYNPAGSGAGGVEGTHAQISYKFDLDMLQEGDKLTIGDATVYIGSETKTESVDGATKFTVSLNDAKTDPNGKFAQIIEAAGFKNGEVRFDPDAKTMTIQGINVGEKAADLAKVAKVSLSSTTRASMETGGLKLQIGDTADDYNQMQVSINDCHADAMGIGDINISSQDGAAEAMKAIKEAINYVSDVRGTLGATQNRLDHTINNLSVMQENIQDAESTIRDVDVAEEMMAYTKNNILVQSAQAMLAQANQVPQGVLQLLQ